jgi:hypothetical protein
LTIEKVIVRQHSNNIGFVTYWIIYIEYERRIFGDVARRSWKRLERVGANSHRAVDQARILSFFGAPINAVSIGPGENRPSLAFSVRSRRYPPAYGHPESSPAFFFHLGDVVYSFGEAMYYYDQFYEPYRNYPAPIFALAGNHDGMVAPGATTKPLAAFLENFCAEKVVHTPEAGGLDRTAMIQPGVYYTFEATLVRIICPAINLRISSSRRQASSHRTPASLSSAPCTRRASSANPEFVRRTKRIVSN